MSKTLIIAEKPSVGKGIAGELPGPWKEEEGYMEGKDHVVSWALGHLLRLAPPEHYKPAWKRWRRDQLPLLPEGFEVQPGAGRAKTQLAVVKKLWKREDISEVWNACDAGREGELIFAWIKESVGGKAAAKTVRRVWLSSMTSSAIKDAVANTKPEADYKDLEAAARSRAEADWIVGLSATRAATIQFRSSWDGSTSLGRVQTPTLAILAKREEEILAFKPKKFWIVGALIEAKSGKFKVLSKEGEMDEKRAKEIVAATDGQGGKISSLQKTKVVEKPPLLFDLTSLQRAAGSKMGWTAKRTLAVAQSLYDKHGAITYPRTDSKFLTDDMRSSIKKRASILDASLQEYVKKLPAKEADAIFDNAKVKDHHAIIPTEQALFWSANDDEQKLYDMVCRRFLAAMFPAAEAERTALEVSVSGKDGADHLFKGKGKIYKVQGWREIEGLEEGALPLLAKDEEVLAKKVGLKEKETKPPRRYSDASLLGAMETAGKEIDDEEAREAMKEQGIGTPATRASIIERLIEVEYLERQGRSLHVTDKGLKLVRALKENDLLKPELTGQWEAKLVRMESGKEKREEFMSSIASFAEGLVKGIIETDAPEPENRKWGKCPSCERQLMENRKAVSCWQSDDPGCGRSVWKRVFGKTLPESQLRELVETGKTTEPVKGLKTRRGKTFEARLRIEEKDGKWQSVIDEEWAKEATKPSAKKPAEADKKETQSSST